MLTEEENEKIKQLVYASTRYDEPQKSGNFPQPGIIDKLIEMEMERHNEEMRELEERKTKLQNDHDLLMNLTKTDIEGLTVTVRKWLVHAIPKYGPIVEELQEETTNE